MVALNTRTAGRVVDAITKERGGVMVYIAQQHGFRVASGTNLRRHQAQEWDMAHVLAAQTLRGDTDYVDDANVGVLLAEQNGGPIIGVVVLMGVGGSHGHALVREMIEQQGFGLADMTNPTNNSG